MARDVHAFLLDFTCSNALLINELHYSVASPKHRCSPTVVIDPAPGY
jgi:hypothetical protein